MKTNAAPACLLFALLAAACSRHAEPAPSDAAPSTTTPADRATAERASLECLSIEAPEGTTKAGGVGGGLAFHGAKKLHAGTVSYEPAFTASTLAADGSNSNTMRDELMKSFTEQYDQTVQSAGDTTFASSLQPPQSVPQPVAGTRGHAWQIDSIATFNGERLPWRAFSMTTVYKNRAYVVTAAAALPNVAELKPIADRYFASMRFDACK